MFSTLYKLMIQETERFFKYKYTQKEQSEYKQIIYYYLRKISQNVAPVKMYNQQT